jgi:hypothetical protein
MHKTLSNLNCSQSETVVADLQDIHFIVSQRKEGSSPTKPDMLRHPVTVSVLRDTIKSTLVVVRKCKLLLLDCLWTLFEP